MKKYILALLYLIFSSVLLFSQDSINQIDKKERKQGYWKKYDKETLLYEGLFKDDVPVGIFKYYYADGKLKSTTDFINGTHKVKTQLFHVNGKKSAEGEFIDQQKNGTWYYYSPQEILIKQENYKNGIPNGLWITFSSETAKKLLEENYDNGVLNGLQIRYYTTGDTMNIIPYINGKRNGFAKTFYTGNIVSSNGLYHNDLYNKTWKYFNDKGEIRKEDNYDEMGKKWKHFIIFTIQSDNV
jgi:antitoxin component YwqK of YwqJK toxin-antitoxin module